MADLPAVLVDYLAGQNCVLFLGPDVSEAYGGHRGLPTTWQMAEELAAECGYRGQYRPLPRAAQIYEHRLGSQRLIQYLLDRLDDDAYRPLPIHEILARLPVPAIVHAGWDRLLEQALDGEGVPYQVIRSTYDVGYGRGDRCLLYKPYGSLDRPDSLVITEERQFALLYESDFLLGELRHLMARYCLLMLGYAVDYDSVFCQLYHQIRQKQAEHRPPAFVVQSLDRPEDAGYWEAMGIRSIVADPTRFVYDLALAVAGAQGRALDLGDLGQVSRAEPATQADVQTYTATMDHVLGTLGIAELVEKSDVPLLSAEQVRDLEAMRAAYERLAEGLGDPAESASMWLRQGNVEYVRGNHETAEGYYRRALAIQPDLAEAHHNLHYVYLAQAGLLASAGREDLAGPLLDQARQAYRRAVELKPFLALLPGRYTVDGVLGQGGIGVVYRARDNETGQTVAIKLLNRAHMYNEKAALRFRREALILQRLQDPHIVRLLDSGQYEGRQFIVLEYLGQRSLRRLLDEQGHLGLDQAHDIVQQAGHAVELAHQAGVIHRDLKPSNIFWTESGAKVIDFGLAADLEAGQPSVLGLATGTVRYMSPEQQRGAPADERTDQYALATVFYELLTGRHPDEGTYQPLSQLVPGVEPALDIVVERARQLQPEERYPDVQRFLAELAQVIPTQPASICSARWRRALARLQAGLTRATTDYWFLTLGLGLLAAFVLPYLLPAGFARAACRFLGLAVWDVFFVSLLTRWFTLALARRTGYATLAAYGPLLGTFLGLSTAWMVWTTLRVAHVDYGGQVAGADLVAAHILHGFLGLVVGGVSYLSLASWARLASRLGLSSRAGALLGLGTILLLLALLYLTLGAVGWGGP